jgi:flagellar motility protein MotE (MotC chaperone)
MKFLLSLLLGLSFSTYALAAKNDKKLSPEEKFQQEVKVEVDRQIDLLKKKSIAQLTKELMDKERRIENESKKIVKEKEQLKISEQSLLKNLNELEVNKKKIIGCLDDNKRGEILRVKQLVDVISNMKPQKAADLLSVQESEISIKIIEKIEAQKASKIFNLMDKEVSARLQKQYLNMQQ